MIRSTDRILTTHVGSLVRPPELVAILRAKENNEPVDEKTYEDCLRNSVAEVVRQQAEVGIDIVSDGEFGKSISWSRYVLERLDGFEDRPNESRKDADPARALGPRQDTEQFAEFYAEYNKTQGFSGSMRYCVCTSPITYTGQDALQRDIENFKAALNGVTAEAFMPVVAPASVTPERKDEYYKSEEAYVFAIADALREEYTAIVDAGFMLQVDDAHLPLMYDQMVPPASHEDYLKWAGLRIEALNHALEGIPEERTRYHICWGSFNSPHVGDVPFKVIADLVLSVHVGAYAIEMANPRHEHEWRVWEDIKLPEGKVLIPGVISHTTNVVEHPELVAERLTRLAKLVGRENVIGGTDCGFAQGPFVRRVHPSIMWAKLQALVEGAQLATKELWG
jgi:5-methyltetrahydropteroyltriglutamate--homocysteine methyltransferase